MNKIDLFHSCLIFIHGSFEGKENVSYIYDGYIWADNRNPENLSHYEIFYDFLNSWESPHFKTRDGKDLAFSDFPSQDPTLFFIELAKQGHIVIYNTNLSQKQPNYLMFHPCVLSPKQKEIITNSFLEIISSSIEFSAVDENGNVYHNPLFHEKYKIAEYLGHLIKQNPLQDIHGKQK